ncbi:uncharacterized protein LOC119678205 isoform X1 [Teleopsis dalmanni]|uniref:uncharacterized protein LOC119678205 isoform X1 n=1 Tax=Teleopsis dalmanni TaxID=139649 RepID=UPI0018CE5A07|nr:uncharacterized protein LOC119678205 isoform X1 [Teleopsis dalmanni]
MSTITADGQSPLGAGAAAEILLLDGANQSYSPFLFSSEVVGVNASITALDIENLQQFLRQNKRFHQNISQMLNMSTDNLTNLLTTAQHPQPQRDPLPLLMTLTIFYAFIFVAGVLGNLITCIVISRNRFMHTATNFYLFNLAVSDMILLLSGMPQDLYNLWFPYSYPFTDVLCVMESVLSETAANATVLTITAFTVERYIAICHPFRQHTMSKLSRAIKFIFAIWVTALLLALPQAMQFSVVAQDGGTSCTMKNDFFAHVFAVSGFIFFGGPMTAICVLYVLIGMKLKRSRLLQAVPRRCYDVNRGISAQSRVIRMLVAVAVTFFLCWAPFHAQRLMAVYGSTAGIESKIFNDIFHILDYTSGVLYFLSTCINPLLYNIMSHKFREAFKVTLARHFGLANRYQTQNHNYSALLRQNGSMRLHTTVNNNALEHFNSYRVVQLQCRDPNHHLSLQDSIRTTTTTTTINSANSGSGNAMGGNNSCRSSHRNRCISIGSQSTLLTSLGKNDVYNSNGNHRSSVGNDSLQHRILQTQISQLSSVGDANSLLESEVGSHYHNHAHPSNSYRLRELKRSSVNMTGRSLHSRPVEDRMSINSQNWEESNIELEPHCLEETEMYNRPVAPVAPHIMAATLVATQPVQPMNTIAELSAQTQPSRSRLKLSRIISRRDQDAYLTQTSPRVELMRAHLPGMSNAPLPLARTSSNRKQPAQVRDFRKTVKARAQPHKSGKTLDSLTEKFRWRARKKFTIPRSTTEANNRIRQESSSSTSSAGTPTPTTALMRVVYPAAAVTAATETPTNSELTIRNSGLGYSAMPKAL